MVDCIYHRHLRLNAAGSLPSHPEVLPILVTPFMFLLEIGSLLFLFCCLSSFHFPFMVISGNEQIFSPPDIGRKKGNCFVPWLYAIEVSLSVFMRRLTWYMHKF